MAGRKKTSPQHPHFKRVCSYHGIEEYAHTTNGLRVLYRHDSSAPVAGLMVTYLVGSRHEAVGYTGATHLLEHLMFKGSKNFPKKRGLSVMDLFERTGAMVNASTWLDRTNYYEVLPVEHLDLALRLEADRMRHAIITRRDLTEEMPAVRSEYAMIMNNATETLDQHLWATAYQAHPYHHSTIGWLADIENVSIERLQDFYNSYYWPNNAVVTVVGDVSRNDVLTGVHQYFGAHPRSPHPIPVPYTTEPRQTGRRFIEVQRSGTQNIVGLAYKVPEALHADTPALMVLASVLAEGKASRLHRALVERHLAERVRSQYMPFYDPSLFMLYVTAANRVAHEQVERAVRRELTLIKEGGVSREELARVLAKLETDLAFARDGHYALLSTLNEAIAAGDWKFFFDLPRKIARVSSTDLKRVAQTYIVSDQETMGYYVGTPAKP